MDHKLVLIGSAKETTAYCPNIYTVMKGMNHYALKGRLMSLPMPNLPRLLRWTKQRCPLPMEQKKSPKKLQKSQKRLLVGDLKNQARKKK